MVITYLLNMNINLSAELKEILNYSIEEAARVGCYTVTRDHIILGIIRHQDNSALGSLMNFGIDFKGIKKEIEGHVRSGEIIPYENRGKIVYSKSVESAIRIMYLEAQSLKEASPGAYHLLLAICRKDQNINTNDSIAVGILERSSVTYEKIRALVKGKESSNDRQEGEFIEEEPKESAQEREAKNDQAKVKGGRNSSDTPVIDSFGFDMTKAAAEGKLDPVVGRDVQIERLAQILGRRKKNNPVIIGEPGVGKSAIAEGLAIRISAKNVSRNLLNKRIISLDIGSIVAGTKYRGQFEERIKAILHEMSKNPNIILFIDELHTLVGAGGASGSLDAANMLKPALARGEIQVIGATTLDEYREVIEKDGALERRFQKIMVEPTTYEETYNILITIKERYEQHHNVKYTDDAIVAAIKLSQRYITDRCLPDKAIDALDEAGSRVHLMHLKVPESITLIEKEIKPIKEAKIEAVNDKSFDKAVILKDMETKKMEELDLAQQKWDKEQQDNPPEVNADNIAEVLSMITNVPLFKLAEKESDKLSRMKEAIQQKIIGQDEAVDKVVRAIQRNRAGLKNPHKPIGTFLFLGPTGVGKTQLAKVLSTYMFYSEDSLVRIDMSEYMEKFAVSRLIGAPPGYVGYDEGGQLSEKVRRKPYAVILLDEIEKAHPDIFNILLQVLDEGRLTDSNGRHIDFRNTLLIMTSNIGSRELKDFGSGVGYSNTTKRNIAENNKAIIEKAIKKTFSPEFVNRLDEQILFNPLTQEDICKIIDIELNELFERIDAAGYSLKVTDKAKAFVAEQGYDPQFGARPLNRAIQKYIENPLAEAIVCGEFKLEDKLLIDIDTEGLPKGAAPQKLKVSKIKK